MRKPILLLPLLFTSTFLAAQELKPLPDCNELKEKIITIRQSFDHLLKTFGKMQKSKKDHRTVYSSDFLLCSEMGRLIEDSFTTMMNNETKHRYEISLQFSFVKNDYKASSSEFKAWWQKILAAVREVFADWEYDFESEGNGAMNYHSFSEKTKPGSAMNKEVELDIYEFSTGWSFNLIFQVSNN